MKSQSFFYNQTVRRGIIILFVLVSLIGWQVTGDDPNLSTDSVVSYSATGGTSLMTHETISLRIAGNYSDSMVTGRSVSNQNTVIPAFMSEIHAESSLLGVTSMAAESSSRASDTGLNGNKAAGLRYSIHINPRTREDTYANGTARVIFLSEIREAAGSIGSDGIYYSGNRRTDPDDRTWDENYWDKAARTTKYADITTVSGGILDLSKKFEYVSRISV
ncbi:MAG: hypothetical protein JXA44_07085 [Methanospirillaceae archaeon]|nr:hypothetical protein [Methanospirillaceae archaeon]